MFKGKTFITTFASHHKRNRISLGGFVDGNGVEGIGWCADG
jgi:hypothetical protein